MLVLGLWLGLGLAVEQMIRVGEAVWSKVVGG